MADIYTYRLAKGFGELVCFTERGKKAFEQLGRRQEVWANRIASSVHHSELKVALEVVKELRSVLETMRVD